MTVQSEPYSQAVIRSAAETLSEDLREAAVTYLTAHAASRQTLATTLGVYPNAVEALIRRKPWDLDLSIRVVDALGVQVRANPTDVGPEPG